MRDQLVEGLRGIGDSAGGDLDVDVGLGVGSGVGVVGDGSMVGMGGGQDMELDEGIYGGHELAGVPGGGGESKDHV